jgi:DNA-binding XRE family transcriptional regulator
MNTDPKFNSKLDTLVGPLTFSLFMRVARDSLGITQEEFGKKLKISRSNICDIEKGRQLVSPELAMKIAKQAGLSEKLALQACLQDQVRKAGSKGRVAIS